MNALLNRATTLQVSSLLVAAGGALVQYVTGLDEALFPVTAAVLLAGALVAGLVRHRWGAAVGLAAALYAAVTSIASGSFTPLSIGPVEYAGTLALVAGLVTGLAVGGAAVVAAVPRRPGRRWRTALLLAAGLVAVVALTAAGFVARNVTHAAWEAGRVQRAGFVEKQTDVNGTTLNFAEGPDNGPPLLLIHGQVTDWQSWSQVLPALSERFHVFAVDCHGHGRSARTPERYTATAMTADLAQFLRQVVGEPAIVAGHSSGGLVAAGLAADTPDLVRRVILEDPPFFSSVPPRSQQTFNHVDLATPAHDFLRSGEPDFTAYYVRHGAMWDLFGEGADGIRDQALRYRAAHPAEPLHLSFMPPAVNRVLRGMQSYDPRFGDAFHDGSFHEGFDHAEVLTRITVPAVLIHTNWSYDADGILLAAMDADDAERARSLIRDVEFHRVDTGHAFHVEDPALFVRITTVFHERTGG